MEVCSGSDKCLEEYGAVSLLSAFEGVTFAFFSLLHSALVIFFGSLLGI